MSTLGSGIPCCSDQIVGSAETDRRFLRRHIFNPNSAVERQVMSEEQTFRSKDNAFCL
jgi:hypothetical protein